MSQRSYDVSPSLYLIPTPIGNLDDITIRALNVLKTVDFLLCEDTRETGKLLNYFDIKNIGLVTDQGSPIISDPGYIVVREVIKNSFNVISLPGATAFVPALTSSGINPSPFLFYGFLNAKESKQRKELEKLKNQKCTMIFYESPHRIKTTLSNMLQIFGDRNISINREISKIYEEVYRDKISELLPLCDSMKGEMVVVVEGDLTVQDYSDLSVLEHVRLYLDDGITEKEAIKIVAKERNVAKSLVYKEYHDNK